MPSLPPRTASTTALASNSSTLLKARQFVAETLISINPGATKADTNELLSADMAAHDRAVRIRDYVRRRQAFHALLDSPISDDAASVCLEMARRLLRGKTVPQALQLTAVMLAVKAANVTPVLLEEVLRLLLDILKEDPDTKAKLAKRLRHGIRKLLDTQGMRAHALLSELTAGTTEAHGKIVREWLAQAEPKLRGFPLSPRVWADILSGADSDDLIIENSELGYAEWRRGPALPRRAPTTFGSHNANSLFRRIHLGQFASFLSDNPVDVLHISELRGSPLKCAYTARELRLSLFALGYVHVIWNWCPDTPSIHGSAVFSRVPISEVAYGLQEDGLTDPEGRVITTRFGDTSFVWPYTPCSGMYVSEPEAKRTSFDKGFKDHVVRTQRRVGHRKVFVCGDMNVAPTSKHARLGQMEALGRSGAMPSTKPYERSAHADLLREAKLVHAAPEFGQAHVPTWLWHGLEGKTCMTLDHLLMPEKELLPRGSGPGLARSPKVEAFSVCMDTYGSDHRALLFTVGGINCGGKVENDHPRAVTNVCPAIGSDDDVLYDSDTSTGSAAPADDNEGGVPPCSAAGALPVTAWHAPLQLPGDSSVGQPGEPHPRARPIMASMLPALPEDATAASVEFVRCADEARHDGGDAVRDVTPAVCSSNMPTRVPRNMPEYNLPATMPEYDTDDTILPHTHEDVIPELMLRMGSDGQLVRCLVDTGAYYNIISFSAARRMGVPILKGGRLPTLALANNSTCSVIGKVRVPVRFGAGAYLRTSFYVLPESPYDVIFGSHFFKRQEAQIGYGQEPVFSLNVGGTRVHNLYTNKSAGDRPTEVSMLRAAANVVIPARTEMNIPVLFDEASRCLESRRDGDVWGIVSDAENHAVKVARGITCVLGEGVDTHYHCRVLNASTHPVTVKSAKPLATFQPLAERYHVLDGEEWEKEAAPVCLARPVDSVEIDADKEWAQHPHLSDIDLSSARQNLDQGQFDRLRRLILQHHTLFDTRPKEPPEHADECSFDLKPGKDFHAKMRPMNEPTRDQFCDLVRGQLEKKIIEPSTSRFSSPVVLIPKKGGGVRFAVDYRALNKRIDSDCYTLPRVDDALANLNGCNFFSSLDMKEAFWSVPLAEEARKYTAFQTPNGLMQYRRMPMGLKTASAVFCRYVDRMIGELKWSKVLAYVDDLLVFCRGSADDHLATLGEVFARLGRYNMTLGAKKCTFFAKSVGFLGHVVGVDGVRPDPAKVKAIEALSLDNINSHTEMSAAIGLLGYYRRFLPKYTQRSKPLRTKMAKPEAWRKVDGRVQYTAEEQKAFTSLRDALKCEPILGHPDWKLPFEVHTDASYLGLGATLVQKVGGKERVITYASRSLTAAEANYNVWELECLAIVWALKLFRMYLTCVDFTVHTDAAAAKHIMEGATQQACGRVLRWHLAVQDFTFTVVKRKGSASGDVDGLSRLPLASTEPYGEGPTVIEPATMLHASPARRWEAMMLTGLAGTEQAFFGEADKTAATAYEWKTLQRKDTWCIEQALSKSTAEESSVEPGHTFLGANGLLMRKATGTTQDQVLVPESLRAFILRRYHGLPISGHVGRRRTFEMLRRSYYWPSMRKDVKRWVAACLACRRRKTPRPMHAGHPGAVSTAKRPWDTVAIDVVSASATSKDGYTKVLTVLDLFSRYVLAIPIRRARAAEVAGALFTNLFCVFGKPRRIHSDDGREFMNETLKALCKRWSITHTTTGGHQPQANPVERYHRYMNSCMTMLGAKFGEDWPEYLPLAAFSYNASTNDATGFSPYELVMARDEPTLLQHIDLGPEPVAGAIDEAAHRVQASARLLEAYKHVRDQQERMASQRRLAIMQKRGKVQKKLVTYTVGDHVLFWEPAQRMDPKCPTAEEELTGQWVAPPPTKWKFRWTGPHVISARKSDRTGFRYTFYHRERGVDIETHVNKLCSFQPWALGLLSTSWDIDAKRLYRCGEWAEVGSLVVIPLLHPVPFGVARVLGWDAEGSLQLQWLANDKDDPYGTFKPGWLPSGKHAKPYYAETQARGRHVAYTAEADGIHMNQRDVVVHSFELTPSHKLPAPLLRALSAHAYIWWEDKPADRNVVPDAQA